MASPLDGKVALITGAGRGIGRGIALRLARDGADVALVDVVPDGINAVADEIAQIGSKATTFVADVSDRQQVFAAVEHVSGKIINASSIAGHDGFAMLGVYSASKFAVRGLTQAAAKEYAAHAITVNAYCPGIVGTDMWVEIDKRFAELTGAAKGETFEKYARGIALGRPETPDDVAGFVAYLAGPDSDYMKGQAGLIDGGLVYR
jgi:meso-butanediol dehydrogenase / (S,S)-butanediol dehydrogenase / diacetyl reductase